MQDMSRHVSFKIPTKDNPFGISIGQPFAIQEWPLWLMFTADDLEPLTVRAVLKYDDELDVSITCEVMGRE